MALAIPDALTPIIASDAPLLGRLHRLAIKDASARRAMAAGRFPHIASQGIVQALPDAGQPPGSEVLIHGLIGRKLLRHQPPLAPAAQDVKDGIDDPAQTGGSRSPAEFGRR